MFAYAAVDRAQRKATQQAVCAQQTIEGIARPAQRNRCLRQRRERRVVEEEAIVELERLGECLRVDLRPFDLVQELDLSPAATSSSSRNQFFRASVAVTHFIVYSVH